MARALVILTVLFFAVNVVVWTALFNNASLQQLVGMVLGERSGPKPADPAPKPAEASKPSPTANPFANVPPPARPAAAAINTPITAAAPSLQPPTPVQAAAAPQAQGGRSPFSTSIRDADLNTQINTYLSQQGEPPLRDVRVIFAPTGATLTGKTIVGGMAMDVRATGPIVVRNGRLTFLVESLDVGSVAMPDFVRSGVVDAVNETVRRLTSNLNVDVTEATLGQGVLMVKGQTR